MGAPVSETTLLDRRDDPPQHAGRVRKPLSLMLMYIVTIVLGALIAAGTSYSLRLLNY